MNEIHPKLKKLIVEYLLKDLYSVEIIYYRDSIWFIDRENRYWYFEYHKVDKHLWWRWSHFTQGLKIFSMDGEKEQTIFGELVNMILTKKQILEAKYPNKIFKTVGSVLNFEDKVDKVLNNEVETTGARFFNGEWRVEESLNCEVKTAYGTNLNENVQMKEVLNNEVETTQSAFFGDTNDVIDSVLNYEVEKTGGVFYNDDIITNEVLNNEVETTFMLPLDLVNEVDEILNCEVETTSGSDISISEGLDEVLNCEVETTMLHLHHLMLLLDKVLNNEVEKTRGFIGAQSDEVDEVLNCEVKTTQSALAHYSAMVDEVLNCEVETTGFVSSPRDISMGEVLDSDVKIRSGEMIDENEMMNKVLEIQNIQPTERGTSDMVDFVLDVEDYTPWDGKIKHQVSEVITQSPKLIEKQYDIDVVLDNTIEIKKIGYSKTHRLRPVTGALDYNDNPVEIKSIEKLKGENPFQDIIVSHILDESDKVTDKLKMKEDDYVKTYSHDVYMCDHLVQNVLDIGVNSIHYDTHHHQPIVDGILKKA